MNNQFLSFLNEASTQKKEIEVLTEKDFESVNGGGNGNGNEPSQPSLGRYARSVSFFAPFDQG